MYEPPEVNVVPHGERRHNHAIAFAVDLRNAVDDQLTGTPHAGNLYRLLPAHFAEQLEKALKEKQADAQ